MTDLPEYVLDRTFNAPVELVWETWTQADHLSHWYGPGVETIIHEFDVREGGLWFNEMKWGDKSMLSRAVFTRVAPNSALEFQQSSADTDWNVVANPMMPDWPRTVLTTVTFEPAGEKTKLRLIWTPFEASEAEIACFAGAVGNMGKGWESGFALIDDILEQLKAGRA